MLSMFASIVQLVYVMYCINFFLKVLANRLKKLLPGIKTEHQSAFVKDFLVFDNIFVTFETLHCMKYHKSRNSRQGGVVFSGSFDMKDGV